MVATWSGIDDASQNFFAVFGKNLVNGREVNHRDTRRMEAASVIKLPLLVCLLDMVQRGKLRLNMTVSVTLDDRTGGGSGALQHFPPDQPVELSQLCLWMMSVSDNIAANVIIRLVGFDRVNDFMKRIGMDSTELLLPRLDFRKRQKGEFRIGVTTAQDMGHLLVRLLRGELLDSARTEIALQMLESVQNSMFARGFDIDPLARFGSKTGVFYFRNIRFMALNECGFTEGNGSGDRRVMCVLSTQPMDPHMPYSHDAQARLELKKVAGRLYQALR